MVRNEGMLLILSAPSGCGKTTLLNRIMANLPGLAFSISHTTRPPRLGEMHGKDYYFVDSPAFVAMRDQEPSGFLEYAEVHGNLYGTSVEEVNRLRQQGLDVVLDIDVQGAAQVQAQTETVAVFIAPPSMAELEKRLRKRGSETEASVVRRLENARKELACADRYDYLLVNDQLDEATDILRSIIIAERSRRRRKADGQPVRWRE